MKLQEQLNSDYDKIMIDFKQKAFIDVCLTNNRNSYDIENFISTAYSTFSQHFNSEYQHIYLKPLSDLPNKHNIDDTQQSFFNISKQLPSTFWNTSLGEKVTLEQVNLSLSSIFSLPLTEDRKKLKEVYSIYTNIASIEEKLVSLKELSKTDKIKIQENFAQFVDSFINSPILPHNLRLQSLQLLGNHISSLSLSSNRNFNIDFSKDHEFIKDVLSSVNFNEPFQQINLNNSISIKHKI